MQRFQRRRSLLVASFLKNFTISDFSKTQIFRLPITFKLVTSSYLNLFYSQGKIISSLSWRGIFGKDISKINLFFYFFISFSLYVASSFILYRWIDEYMYFICRSDRNRSKETFTNSNFTKHQRYKRNKRYAHLFFFKKIMLLNTFTCGGNERSYILKQPAP